MVVKVTLQIWSESQTIAYHESANANGPHKEDHPPFKPLSGIFIRERWRSTTNLLVSHLLLVSWSGLRRSVSICGLELAADQLLLLVWILILILPHLCFRKCACRLGLFCLLDRVLICHLCWNLVFHLCWNLVCHFEWSCQSFVCLFWRSSFFPLSRISSLQRCPCWRPNHLLWTLIFHL